MKDEEKYLEDEMEKFGGRWPYPASFDGYDKDWVDELTEECAKHFYELGKQAMKEQMLKDAKDGYVSAIIIRNDGDEEHYAVTYPNGERPHSITDKVKIIIL